jgi:hypothetical protein
MEEEKAKREQELLDTLKSYSPHIAAVFIIILGLGLVFPVIFVKFFHADVNNLNRESLEKLYFLSGWFYSIIGFVSFFVIILTVIAAYQQLRLLRTDLRASAYSQIYTRTDSAISLLLHDKVELERFRLDAKQLKELKEADFHFADRTRLVTNMLFTLFENIYYQHEKFGVFDDEDWRTWKVSMKRIFAIPYVKECWERKDKGSYTSGFVQEIEDVMNDRNL